MFEPTRAAGLDRLAEFAPKGGRAYQDGRNFDGSASGKSVASRLSPWLRHRLISEHEVLNAVLAHHTSHAAAPFVQEVFWRGYFKGWLEHHPSVWTAYRSALAPLLDAPPAGYGQAIAGQTGIACFDHWCATLRASGYLHNHARMWFASIWIFTLRLPWELGAAFFLDHLVDGDPASNTLSWRWVAGLHTKGKHYLARAENIARFTQGRFNPVGQLNETAPPLHEDQTHALGAVDLSTADLPHKAIRLLTEEDCLEPLATGDTGGAVLGIVSPGASRFGQEAVKNSAHQRGGAVYIGDDWSQAIKAAADRHGTQDVITARLPTGFVKDGMQRAERRLAADGITLHQVLRPYDAMVWPHANKGFFKLKKQIPQFLATLAG